MNDLSEQIIAHYERHATDWDADRRSSGWNDRKWHERFTALLHPGAAVLDLGCGGVFRSPAIWLIKACASLASTVQPA
jgi:ubiquinone/menaquinone biosynthesis C-methylase UbiE